MISNDSKHIKSYRNTQKKISKFLSNNYHSLYLNIAYTIVHNYKLNHFRFILSYSVDCVVFKVPRWL